MKLLTLIAATLFLMVFGSGDQACAEEYYVIKSRSGTVRVVDHKPTGNATIVKGPFKTREEAEKALTPSVETKSPHFKPQQGKAKKP